MIDKNSFFNKYFALLIKTIRSEEESKFIKAAQKIKKISKKKNKIMVVGNGGSAAMASHVSVDFTKAAKIRAMNFNEADLLTCFSNDYGFEKVFEKAVEFYGNPGDLLILISSSGSSMNVINAAKYAKKSNMEVFTFSGFNSSNSLRKLGDMNFWVDSKAYNIVEMTHHIWLLSIVDFIIGNIEYPAS